MPPITYPNLKNTIRLTLLDSVSTRDLNGGLLSTAERFVGMLEILLVAPCLSDGCAS